MNKFKARISRFVAFAQVALHWFRRSTLLRYPPTEISIETTNRCNFKCGFCPQSDPSHADKTPLTSLSVERADLILTKLRRGGVRTDVIHWTLDGEPFMNKQFSHILARGIYYGFLKHRFFSNGFFCDLERLRSLPCGLGIRYFLNIDMCADESYFEEHRGIPGSWEIVRRNVNTILSQPELKHIHLTITDISSFTINDPQELERRRYELTALFPRSRRLIIQQRSYHNMAGFLEPQSMQSGYHCCPYPWFSLFVASNGDVVACNRDLEHQTVHGNLFDKELQEIWNGESYKTIRGNLRDAHPERSSACAGCEMPGDSRRFSLLHIARSAFYRALLTQ